MKAKKIVATVLGTALVASAAAGLTACNKGGSDEYGSLGTTTLDLVDYAARYMLDNNVNRSGYVAAKRLVSNGGAVSGGNYVTVENDGKYSVYNLDNEKTVLFDCATAPVSNNLGSLAVWRVDDTLGTRSAYYTKIDGTQILPEASYTGLQSTLMRAYVGNDTEVSSVYRIYGDRIISGTDARSRTEAVEVFLKEVTDPETGSVTGYTVISKDYINMYRPDFGVGTTHNGLQNVYTSTEQLPVEGDAADYKYMQLGSRFTFYNGTKKAGTVDVTVNGEVLGFVGNYLYFYEQKPVIGDDKDFNMVTRIISSSQYGGLSTLEYKFDYSLYRYDFTKDRLTELDCDVAVTELEPVYNYATNAYDAAVIGGVKMTDGVATSVMSTISSVGGYAEEFAYFVNCDLKVGFDMTGIYEAVPRVYSVGKDRFLVSGSVSGSAYTQTYIVDGKFNVIMSNVRAVYVNDGLATVSYGSYTGLTDLDGKVVVAPQYTGGAPVFYNGVALVNSATDGYVLLKKDGSVAGKISDLEKSDSADVTKTVETGAGYYKLTTASASSVTVDYVAFDGTLLRRFTHGNVGEILVNGSVVIREAVTAAGGATTYTYYKLA